MGKTDSASAWWRDFVKSFAEDTKKRVIQGILLVCVTGAATGYFLVRNKLADYVANQKNIDHEIALRIAKREIGVGVVDALPFRDRVIDGQLIAVWAYPCVMAADYDPACDTTPSLSLLWGNNDVWAHIKSEIPGGTTHLAADGWIPGSLVDWDNDGRKEILSRLYLYSGGDGAMEDMRYSLVEPSTTSLNLLSQVQYYRYRQNVSFKVLKTGTPQETAWVSHRLKTEQGNDIPIATLMLMDWMENNGQGFEYGEVKTEFRPVAFNEIKGWNSKCRRKFGHEEIFVTGGSIYAYNTTNSTAALLYPHPSNDKFFMGVSFNDEGVIFGNYDKFYFLDVARRAVKGASRSEGPSC